MRKILVVDDNEDILEATAELLRLQGFEVATVSRSDLVLEAIKKDRPDLMLQDCHMPGLDLAKLIGSIRAQPSPKKLPILLFTASVEAQDFWKDIGADGLVRKPFEGAELGQLMERYIPVPLAGGPSRSR